MIVGTSTSTTLLRGRISNYRKTRKPQDFLVNQSDREQAGLISIAAALAGSSGAVGLAGIIDTKEEADLVEFDMDGKAFKGWITWSPFNENDNVEIVAEYHKNEYRVFGIKRVDDRVVALHPHCSRGRTAHNKTSVKWWLNITIPLYMFTTLVGIVGGYFNGYVNSDSAEKIFFGLLFWGAGGSLIFTGLIAYSLSRRFMPFVRMAEAIFTGFGWEDVKNIDLPAISKKNRQPGDGPGMGRLYFRY